MSAAPPFNQPTVVFFCSSDNRQKTDKKQWNISESVMIHKFYLVYNLICIQRELVFLTVSAQMEMKLIKYDSHWQWFVKYSANYNICGKPGICVCAFPLKYQNKL